MRLIRSLLSRPVLCLSALLSLSLQAACEPPKWLAGHWQSPPDGKGGYWQEQWQRLDDDNWQGQGRQFGAGGVAKGNEDLRLVQMGGQWFYLAKVAHNDKPIAFLLEQCAPGRLQFSNAAHDFPKQLIYQFNGNDSLAVEVSDGAGKGFSLHFARRSPEVSQGAVETPSWQ